MKDTTSPEKKNGAEKNRYRASNSFRKEEVEAMNQLFDILGRGGDASAVARSEPVRKVRQKFQRMRQLIGRKG